MPTNGNSTQGGGRSTHFDRIFAVIIIVALILIAIVRGCTSCSNKSKDEEDIIEEETVSDEVEEATESEESIYAGAVYLSPSTRSGNTFATGDTNEAVVCKAIANKTKTLLEGVGLTVIIADDNASEVERVAMGDYSLGAYVKIQTNQGVDSGTSCFYDPASAQSQSLAQAVYNEVSTLTERDDNGLIDGTNSANEDDYCAELVGNNSTACVIEVEFHDTVTIAQWILDNEDAIADSIAQGICNYLGVTYTSSVNTTGDTADEGATEESDGESNAIEDQLSE